MIVSISDQAYHAADNSFLKYGILGVFHCNIVHNVFIIASASSDSEIIYLVASVNDFLAIVLAIRSLVVAVLPYTS